MHIQTSAQQQAPRAIKPSPDTSDTRTPEREPITHDDRETMLDDDLYGNLAHTD